MSTKFWLESLKGRHHSEHQGISLDGDNIKMDLTEIGFEGVDWIYLAQDKDRRRPLVNTAMNLRVL
jgi:hypothetical protein